VVRFGVMRPLIVVGAVLVSLAWAAGLPGQSASAASQKSSIDSLKAEISKNPSDATLHYKLGNVYYESGRRKAAAAEFEKAIQLDGNYVRAYVNLGVVQAELGQSESALRSYKKALEIKPGDPLALSNLGNTYYSLREFSQAVDSYRAALESDPDCYEAHFGLGIAFADVRMYREAMAEWEKVAEIAPGSEAARTAQANIAAVKRIISGE